MSGNGDYSSPFFVPVHAGTYRWRASYSGDADNEAAGPTVCGDPAETVSVGRDQPGFGSAASGAVDLGGAVQDRAQLTGGSSPTGTISFALFGPLDDACAGSPVFTSSATVSGNGDYLSGLFTPTVAGVYHWRASYSGDADNAPAGPTACTDPAETFTVRPSVSVPVTPVLTSVASGVARASAPLSDTAHLAGGNAPTGAIGFELFGPDDATCSAAPVFTSSTAVNGNGAYTSASFTATAVGTYRWRATYGGDTNNTSVGPTACGDPAETTVISKAQPALTSTASTAAGIGAPVHDTAHLSGGSAPSGTITFQLYGPGDTGCAAAAVSVASVPVSGNGDYSSPFFVPVHAGTYRWRASYSGDADNEAAGPTVCGDPAETVSVGRDQPGFGSAASGAVDLGGAVQDRAQLTGGSSPTGTISFALFGPLDDACAGSPVFTSSATVSGNGDYLSGLFTPTVAGVYHWRASYSGDADNAPAGPTACTDPAETFTVRPSVSVPVTPVLTSVASGVARASAPLSDTAHLAGGNAPTGAIGFELFGPDDATCSAAPVFTSSTAVNGNGAYTSASFTATAVGTYRWRATYGGDTNNTSVGPTACGDPAETTVISKAQPALTSTASTAAGIGAPIRDTAHLSGGSAPTGTITFQLYGPGDTTCAARPVSSARVQVVGAGDYASPLYPPAHAGTYRWTARYSGDANNEAVGPTRCGDPAEHATVHRADLGMFSLASGATVRRLAQNRLAGATGGRIGTRPRVRSRRYRAAGLTLHDTVHLSGGSDPGGFVSFRLFGPGDDQCSAAPVFVTETVVVGNGDIISASFTATAAGIYRWVATYSGDSDNAPAGPTRCGDPAETVVIVQPADPAFSSTASGSVDLGGAIHDTAHLTNGADPTGTITFSLFGPDNPSCSGTPVFSSQVNVSGNGSYDSEPFTPGAPGQFRWVAAYSGDSRNIAAGPTACGDAAEIVDVRPAEVKPATPGFSTLVPATTAARATPIYDVAHLTGGSKPTGVITFALYGPDDRTCQRAPVFISQVAVSGAGNYSSAFYVPAVPGAYRWVASYSGDAANASSGPTACGEANETVSVSSDPAPNPNPPLTPAPILPAGEGVSPGHATRPSTVSHRNPKNTG